MLVDRRHTAGGSDAELDELPTIGGAGAKPATQEGLRAGSLVADNEIERELGRGGMGAVFLATQRTLGRKVAVKVMLGGSTLDPDAKARFLREAQAQASIEHPSVVRVYSFGESDGFPHFAMEYVEGTSLAGRLGDEGKIPYPEVLHFTDVGSADEYCRHAHYLWATRVIDGCGPTTYCPTDLVTREQMAKFLVNAFKLQAYGP